MDELRLARRKLVRKNSGEGRGSLPLRRKFVREKIEVDPKHKEVVMNPDDPRLLRLAEMDAEIAEMRRERQADYRQFLTEKDARVAGEIDTKAQQLMRSNPNLDYGSAVRMVAANDENFPSGGSASAPRVGRVYGTEAEMREAVEQRMASDPEYYPDEETDEGEPVGSVHDMDRGDYDRELRQAMKERGYDA